MKNKLLNFGIASIFVSIFLMSFASAVEPPTIAASLISDAIVGENLIIQVNIINNANTTEGFILNVGDYSSWADSVNITPQTFTIDANDTKNITITFLPLQSGEQSFTLYLLSLSEGETFIQPVVVQINPLELEHPQDIQDCSLITNNDLDVKIDDINVIEGFGDDYEWFPVDEIEVEIEVENKNNDDDIDDIELEWGLYNSDTDEWYIDDKESDFDLKDDEEETITIRFKLDDDIDELENGGFVFYVWANGVLDDDTDEGTDLCAYDSKEIKMIIEKDFVILDNIDMPETLSCGETVTITADVWNIGDDEQKDVSVEISGRESALDFRETIEVGDIDEFDRQQISFTFTVPKNIDEKFYALNFEVNEDDGDIYENDFDDEAKFTVPFKVEGNCGMGVADVIISANLESEAKAGKDLVIKATITNNEDELKTFTVNAAGFAQWASSYNVDRTSLVLNAGESADVLFTFDVNKDASGSQSFTIELLSGDNQITTQPVSVVIEGKSGLLSSITTGNTYLWGIGILNIVLIVIIILVAVRIARRK